MMARNCTKTPPEACALSEEALQVKLKELTHEIASDLAMIDAAHSKELLSDFVSDLFLALADQRRREERRQRQAEGIAAAKAKGVRFGRTAAPVPENFDALHRAWRDGEMSLSQAAAACGMVRGTFYQAAVRREQAEERAV